MVLGFENEEKFKNAIEELRPSSTETINELHHLAKASMFSMNREDQWLNNESHYATQLTTETWHIIAYESSMAPKKDEWEMVLKINPYFKMLFGKQIKYDAVHPYWIENISFKELSESFPFFHMNGLLKTPISSDNPIYTWEIEAFCALRKTPEKGKETIPYPVMDFEMIPSSEEFEQNRTFGHAYMKRRTASGNRWDGYYLTNRLRDPRPYAKPDGNFIRHGSAQIATGRCSMVLDNPLFKKEKSARRN